MRVGFSLIALLAVGLLLSFFPSINAVSIHNFKEKLEIEVSASSNELLQNDAVAFSLEDKNSQCMALAFENTPIPFEVFPDKNDENSFLVKFNLVRAIPQGQTDSGYALWRNCVHSFEPLHGFTQSKRNFSSQLKGTASSSGSLSASVSNSMLSISNNASVAVGTANASAFIEKIFNKSSDLNAFFDVVLSTGSTRENCITVTATIFAVDFNSRRVNFFSKTVSTPEKYSGSFVFSPLLLPSEDFGEQFNIGLELSEQRNAYCNTDTPFTNSISFNGYSLNFEAKALLSKNSIPINREPQLELSFIDGNIPKSLSLGNQQFHFFYSDQDEWQSLNAWFSVFSDSNSIAFSKQIDLNLCADADNNTATRQDCNVFLDLNDGEYFLQLFLSDGFFDASTVSGNFFIDNTPPALEILSPPLGLKTTDSNVSLDFNAVDFSAIERIEFSLDSNEFIDCNGLNHFDFNNLKPGKHFFSVRAIDVAGNSAEKEVSFFIEELLPSPTPTPALTPKPKPRPVFVPQPSFQGGSVIVRKPKKTPALFQPTPSPSPTPTVSIFPSPSSLSVFPSPSPSPVTSKPKKCVFSFPDINFSHSTVVFSIIDSLLEKELFAGRAVIVGRHEVEFDENACLFLKEGEKILVFYFDSGQRKVHLFNGFPVELHKRQEVFSQTILPTEPTKKPGSSDKNELSKMPQNIAFVSLPLRINSILPLSLFAVLFLIVAVSGSYLNPFKR